MRLVRTLGSDQATLGGVPGAELDTVNDVELSAARVEKLEAEAE